MNANISANLYDGKYDAGFDCCGVTKCKFAAVDVWPPDEDSKCIYNEYACKHPAAQLAALESLRKCISRDINKLKEELDYEYDN